MTKWDTPTDLSNIVERYGVPDPSVVGKLPRVTCRDCSDASSKVCTKHAKARCDQKSQPRRTDGWCGNWMSEQHMHIDYVGHAEITRILTEIDPTWHWTPLGSDDNGTPVITYSGKEAVLWGSLFVFGHGRIGVGTCEKGKHDEAKELIGDFLRNAAMRFGIGLRLWSKNEWESTVDETPASTSPPQDRIATTRTQAAAVVDAAAKHVVSDEEKAAAAALVDPEAHPDIALIAKYGSKARVQIAARAAAREAGGAEPTSFDKILEDAALVKFLLGRID